MRYLTFTFETQCWLLGAQNVEKIWRSPSPALLCPRSGTCEAHCHRGPSWLKTMRWDIKRKQRAVTETVRHKWDSGDEKKRKLFVIEISVKWQGRILLYSHSIFKKHSFSFGVDTKQTQIFTFSTFTNNNCFPPHTLISMCALIHKDNVSLFFSV